jgi:hypothetical protein
MVDQLAALRSFLESLSPGSVEDRQQLTTLLAKAWDSFVGSSNTKMYAHKLDRIEQPVWRPPILEFDIERHGATVNGSTRASVHTWTIDLNAMTATISSERRRQIYQQDRRLDVRPIAAELAGLITGGRESRFLKWFEDGSVVVKMKECIPTTNKQTTTSRRRRLRTELEKLLNPLGWAKISSHRYARGKEDCSSPLLKNDAEYSL